MRTKTFKNNKINIITLGCSKNLVDSEVLLSQLKGNDIEATHESQKNDANIVVINTCGFIDNAKQESIDTILQYASEKELGHIEKLYVTGCLSQRYKDALEEEIPQVDAYFGTFELPSLLNKLGADYKHELIGERLITTTGHYAYLKISEGCDRPCSFCAIPLMRGKHVSKTIEQICEEARNLAKNGTREIMLIAQDSTYYGIDLYGKRSLAELLQQLTLVEGVDWIRLHYAYPSQFPMEVLPIMAADNNICKYIDIPVQHISDNVLKAMRRGITKRRTYELLNQIKEAVPGIAIRTTILVGHPGESETDFEELKQFVRDFEFDRLGVFTYSHEENTHSHTLNDDVPPIVKQKRAEEIMAIQEEISYRKNQEKIGKVFKVLIDRKEGNYFVGRTEFDSPEVDNEVLIDAQENYLKIGEFAQIQVTAAEHFDLFGKLV